MRSKNKMHHKGGGGVIIAAAANIKQERVVVLNNIYPDYTSYNYSTNIITYEEKRKTGVIEKAPLIKKGYWLTLSTNWVVINAEVIIVKILKVFR